MLGHSPQIKLLLAPTFTLVALLTTSVYGQSPATTPVDKEVVAAQGPRLAKPENKKAQISSLYWIKNPMQDWVMADSAAWPRVFSTPWPL